MLAETAPVLRQYGIQPDFVESYGRVYKVYSKTGQYALKKIDSNTGTGFIRNVQYLFQRGFNRMVPVYPATDGRYAILEKGSLYYLMPWLPNGYKANRSDESQQFFRELARLHTLSAAEVDIGKEDRERHYEAVVKQWEKDEEFLDGFIESCENEWYPSPFQMLFCQYYQDIRQAMGYSRRKLDDWKENTAELTKARMVMLHGKSSLDHFVFDERGYGYFINFEGSTNGSPIRDLLPFFAERLRVRPRKVEEHVEWLSTYQKHFPLREDEKLLFKSYMAYPSAIIRSAQSYHAKERNVFELRAVQKFQKLYWQLKNTEYVVMRVEEIEKQRGEAEASQSASS